MTESTKKLRELLAFVVLGAAAVLVLVTLAGLFSDANGNDFGIRALTLGYSGNGFDPMLAVLAATAVVLVSHLGGTTPQARLVVMGALGVLGLAILVTLLVWIGLLTADGGGFGPDLPKISLTFTALATLALLGGAAWFAVATLSALPAPVKAQPQQQPWQGQPGQAYDPHAPQPGAPQQWGPQGSPQQGAPQQEWGQQAGWAAAGAGAAPEQSWGQPQEQQGWGQPAAPEQAAQSWGQPQEQQAGWGQPAAPEQSWGQPQEQQGWGQPAAPEQPAQSWGQPQEQQPGWGQPVDESAWGRAEQPAAPSWGEPAPEQPAAPSWGEPAPEQPAAPSWGEPAPEQPAPSWGRPDAHEESHTSQIPPVTDAPADDATQAADAGSSEDEQRDDRPGWWGTPT